MRASAIASLGLLPLTLASLLAAGCTSHADSTDTAEEPVPEPKPTATAPSVDEPEVDTPPDPPEAEVELSVASVQLFEDCTDPKPRTATSDEPPPAPAKSSTMAKPAGGPRAKRAPGSAPLRQPCTQSNVQLSVVSKQGMPANVQLTEVRLRLKDGKDALSEIPFRLPKRWADQRYDTWDGVVAPNSELKASYSLGLPDWSAVEKAIGGTSFGPMYVLEFDLTVDGVKQTLESPAVPRERSARVVT